MQLERTFNVRLSDAEMSKLQRVARKWRLTPSATLRTLITTVDERARPVLVLEGGATHEGQHNAKVEA